MSKDANTFSYEFHYGQLVEMWRSFCDLHTSLFELTCEEYLILLKSDIEGLEEIILKKDKLIEEIKVIEKQRRSLIEEINASSNAKIQNVSDLLNFFHEYDKKQDDQFLKKFNQLLISIIEKIQDQNKKNQQFLNKAILSLKDIKTSFRGKQSFTTYNSQGSTTQHVLK